MTGAITRIMLEQREDSILSPAATRSSNAQRQQQEDPCKMRTAFQRDRDRVIHSKAFRRLKHKTQVFLSPDSDHYRTRLTHTLEVTQIARTVGRSLGLNEDLIEAIGMAHDLGHTPFGHAGERALAEVLPGFRHNEQSLRVVDFLERDGRGLNLTDYVRNGIEHHSKPAGAISGHISEPPHTPEAQVLKVSDGVAYINHDLDDAIRAGVLSEGDIPAYARTTLGRSHGERIDSLVSDIVSTSLPLLNAGTAGEQMIQMSDAVRAAADELRDYLFNQVYAPINAHESTLKAQGIVRFLFQHAVEHPESIPLEFRRGIHDHGAERVAADYVAGMTDRYAIRTFEAIHIPQFWLV